MKTKRRFSKGDIVRILDLNSHFYDETAEVLHHDDFTQRVILGFPTGYKCEMDSFHLAHYLDEQQEKELKKAHLLQLADLALEMNDREWFKNVTNYLHRLNLRK